MDPRLRECEAPRKRDHATYDFHFFIIPVAIYLVKKKTLSLPVVPLLSVLPVSVVIVSHDIHEVKVLVQLGQVVGDGNLQKTRTH